MKERLSQTHPVTAKRNKQMRQYGIMCAAMAFLPLLFIGQNYMMHVAILVLFYAFCGNAWTILCGFVGEISMGHSIFIGLGAYTSTVMVKQLQVSPWVGMLGGIVICVLISFVIGLPCFRLNGPYFSIATIAFSQLLNVYMLATNTIGPIVTDGSKGLTIRGEDGTGVLALLKNFLAVDKEPYYWLILVFFAASIFLIVWMKNSRIGNYLTAIQSNHDAAQSLGINITKYKMIAMAISAALTSMGGTFYAQYFRYITPTNLFAMSFSVSIAIFALIGGRGATLGPLVGSLVLVPLTELLTATVSSRLPGSNLFVYGVVLAVVVLYMPKGIVGLIQSSFSARKNRGKPAKTDA